MEGRRWGEEEEEKQEDEEEEVEDKEEAANLEATRIHIQPVKPPKEYKTKSTAGIKSKTQWDKTNQTTRMDSSCK